MTFDSYPLYPVYPNAAPNPLYATIGWNTLHFDPSIRFKKLDSAAVMPSRGTAYSAGLDLYAIEDAVIRPGQTVRVRTGLAVALPTGTVGFIKPRSSAFFKGLDLDGTIDADYRGELLLQIRNAGIEEFHVKKGERYAQLVVLPYYQGLVLQVEELPPTERGTDGFGSTGA